MGGTTRRYPESMRVLGNGQATWRGDRRHVPHRPSDRRLGAPWSGRLLQRGRVATSHDAFRRGFSRGRRAFNDRPTRAPALSSVRDPGHAPLSSTAHRSTLSDPRRNRPRLSSASVRRRLGCDDRRHCHRRSCRKEASLTGTHWSRLPCCGRSSPRLGAQSHDRFSQVQRSDRPALTPLSSAEPPRARRARRECRPPVSPPSTR